MMPNTVQTLGSSVKRDRILAFHDQIRLDMERLEPRCLLNADFSFDGNWLQLDNFTAGETLTILEGPASYEFELSGGLWQGSDGPGVSGNGLAILSADKSTLNSASGGISVEDSFNVDFDVTFESLDLSNLAGQLLTSGLGSIEQSAGSSVLLPNVRLSGQNVILNEVANDFGNASVFATQAMLHDVNEIQIGDSAISGDFLLSAGGLVSSLSASAIHVGGLLDLSSDTEIRFGDAADVQTSQVSFRTPGAAIIIMQDVEFTGSNMADTLLVISAGDISDADDAVIRVSGHATFIANELTGSINLADDPNQNATGPASTTDVIEIGNFASFEARQIRVGIDGADPGSGAHAAFGLLNFQSDGSVFIYEDDSTLLFGDNDNANPASPIDLVKDNRADQLTLGSAGTIEDAEDTVIKSHRTEITAGGGIVLGDDPNRSGWGTGFSTDYVFLRSGTIAAAGDIHIGLDGTHRAAGARVEIARMAFQSPANLKLVNDQTLTLRGTTEVRGLDIKVAGAILSFNHTSVTVHKRAEFDASLYVDLARAATQSLTVEGTGIFRAPDNVQLGANQGLVHMAQMHVNTGGHVWVNEQSGIHLVGVNRAGQLTMFADGTITAGSDSQILVAGDAQFEATLNITFLSASPNDRLEVSGLAHFKSDRSVLINGLGISHFGRITVDIVSTALIWEDSSTRLAGNFSSQHLAIMSAGLITDQPGTSITTRGLVLSADGGIYIADRASDVINATGRAEFAAFDEIAVNGIGTTHFGELNFRSSRTVSIYEDSSTHLALNNHATAAMIVSSGNITNRPGTQISTQYQLSLTAGGRIWMATNAQDVFDVGGRASFKAEQQIFIGDPSTVNFGQLQFQTGGYAQINEDSSTYLVRDNRAFRLDLSSQGVLADGYGTKLVVSENAALFAESGIFLADQSPDIYKVCVFAQLYSSEFVIINEPGSVTFHRWVALGGGFNRIHIDSMQC